MKTIIYKLLFLFILSYNINSQTHQGLFIVDKLPNKENEKIEISNIIIPGWNFDIIKITKNYKIKLHNQYELIVVFVGTEELFNNRNHIDNSLYLKYDELVKSISKFTNHIVLVTIPYPINNITRQLHEYNTALFVFNQNILEYIELYEYTIIDINAYFSFIEQKEDINLYYEKDFIHINELGLQSILQILQKELHKD